MRLARRWLAALLLFFLAGTVAPAPSGAVESAVWVGACPLMTLRLNLSGPVGLLPAARSATFSGSTNCTVLRSATLLPSVSVTFAGTLTDILGLWSCDTGVMVGTGQMFVADPSWPNPPLNVVVVSSAHAITLEATDVSGLQFLAVATLAQTNLCELGSTTQLTWTGPVVFEDPKVEL